MPFPSQNPTSPYRPEIDGLRAFAVVAVILYHAGIPGFSGGFVGVDIFFVISGYLITRILMNQLHAGTFSFKSFYERRARRIFPALFLVMIVSIPFAWLWLPENEMQDFTQSVIFATLFSSNILFWQESGYFATSSELKPLLHTWSLGVEEQFYLVFPVLLLLLWNFRKESILKTLSVLGLLSLALSQLAIKVAPVAAFYLLPSRFWELAIGSVAALLMAKGHFTESSRPIAEVASWSGLILMIYAVMSFDSATPFPGLFALVPVLGAFLLIVFAQRGTSLANILSTKVLVGIGLISYSAYLWHYPAFAFSKRFFPSGPGVELSALIIVVVMAVSFFTWKFVELPIRSKEAVRSKPAAVGGLLIASCLIAFGLWGHVTGGFRAATTFNHDTPSSEQKTSADFIVIGDSHAQHLVPGLSELTRGEVEDRTSAGCIPLRDVDRFDFRFARGNCAEVMNSHLDFAVNEDPDAVLVLSSMGPVYLDGTVFNGLDRERVRGLGVELITNRDISDRWLVYEIGLRNTFEELSELNRARVVFVIDVPELGIRGGCNLVGKEINLGPIKLRDQLASEVENCEVPRDVYDDRAQKYKALVYSVGKEFPRIEIFDPTNVFCDDISCKGRDQQGRTLYRDADHLSTTGSLLVATAIVQQLGLN